MEADIFPYSPSVQKHTPCESDRAHIAAVKSECDISELMFLHHFGIKER